MCREHPKAVQQQRGGAYGRSLCLSLMTSQNLAKNKSPELLQPRSQGAAGFTAASAAHSPDACLACFPVRSWGCQHGRARGPLPGVLCTLCAPQCWSVPRPSCLRGAHTPAPSPLPEGSASLVYRLTVHCEPVPGLHSVTSREPGPLGVAQSHADGLRRRPVRGRHASCGRVLSFIPASSP